VARGAKNILNPGKGAQRILSRPILQGKTPRGDGNGGDTRTKSFRVQPRLRLGAWLPPCIIGKGLPRSGSPSIFSKGGPKGRYRPRTGKKRGAPAHPPTRTR